MIYTSYFANFRKFPENFKQISISRFSPKWFKSDSNAIELAPSSELLLKYKEGSVSEEDFDNIYREQLAKLNAREIAEKYDNSIFLCYEKDGDFCHRTILKDWLISNNVEIKELT